MTSYEDLPGFDGVYLEDSYLLSVEEDDDIVFVVEAVLTPKHRQYAPPRPGEQHSYRQQRIVFPAPAQAQWLERHFMPITDPDGSVDYGNIDDFVKADDGSYELSGEWGAVRIASPMPRLEDANQP